MRRASAIAPPTTLTTLLLLAGAGCQAPNIPARTDFRALGISSAEQEALTSSGVRDAYAKRPAASFPARLAVARVQSADPYRPERGICLAARPAFVDDAPGWQPSSPSSAWSGSGRDASDAKTVDAHARLARLPQVAGVTSLNPLVLPGNVHSEEQLRRAAASLGADLLLLYALDTNTDNRRAIPLVGLLTLGLFPSKEASAQTSGVFALLDVRTGYVYGTGQSSSEREQLTNRWDVPDRIVEAAEREALVAMLGEFERVWEGVAWQVRPASSVFADRTTPLGGAVPDREVTIIVPEDDAAPRGDRGRWVWVPEGEPTPPGPRYRTDGQ